MARLGVITIGQTPRVDLVPELQRWMPGVDIIERGALDGMTRQDIAALAPGVDDEVLTTRLTDGSAVIIGGARISTLLQHAVTEVEPEVDAVLLACTGKFPTFQHAKPLISPDRLVALGTAALVQNSTRIGVVCPLPEQEHDSVQKFQPHLAVGTKVLTEAASPYTDSIGALKSAAQRLAERGAEIIALDCMGYTDLMRHAVCTASGVHIVLARSIVARLASELLDSLPSTTPEAVR